MEGKKIYHYRRWYNRHQTHSISTITIHTNPGHSHLILENSIQKAIHSSPFYTTILSHSRRREQDGIFEKFYWRKFLFHNILIFSHSHNDIWHSLDKLVNYGGHCSALQLVLWIQEWGRGGVSLFALPFCVFNLDHNTVLQIKNL